MKYVSILFIFLSLNAFAQPANDDCSGIVNLGSVPNCSSDNNFTNTAATASDIGFEDVPANCVPNGATSYENDVWFQFNTIGAITDVSIIIKGINDDNAIANPQIVLYRGECGTDGLASLNCASADSATNNVQLDVQGLTANTTFFIRVSAMDFNGADNSGDFNLCIQEFTPTFTISEGMSNSCVGTLYDDGGPDGNYSDSQNSTFTICPQDFHSCIKFNMVYFNIESASTGGVDNVLIFDGNDTEGTLLADLTGFNFDAGGGGVCFSVTATSGCLTVQMISDGSVNFEGFEANWECTIDDCDVDQPIVVEQIPDFAAIEAILSTPASLVRVIGFDCPDGASGIFQNADNTDLGIDRGVVMSSGLASGASGPNTDEGLTTEFFTPGDADLDTLSNLFGDSTASEDACVLELEITANTDEIQFEYVFGSDEYPEFVDQFNDIFAFLISGNGITGEPLLGGQQNIAVIPETGDPIQINSVNNFDNWEYYRQNDLQGSGLSVQYDGLTSDKLGVKKSLTARASVTPCETYRLKLAIADRGDAQFDSGVFISEISGGTPDMEIVFASGLDYFIEDCSGTADVLRIVLSEPIDTAFSVQINISGTAELGVDYTLDVPGTVTFAPGETEKIFPLIPITDNIFEDEETIIIEFTSDFGCGPITFKTIETVLRDDAEIQIELEGDTVTTCTNNTFALSVTGATEYAWSPEALFDDPTSATPNISPVADGWIFVTGTVGNCQDTDSAYVRVVDPSFEVFPEDEAQICQGESLQLLAQSDFPIENITWTPAFNLNNPNIANPVFTDQFGFGAFYTATATIANCEFSGSVDVIVDPFDEPNILFSDTSICAGTSLQLAEEVFFTSTVYEWLPDTFLNDNTIPNAIASPEDTIQYILTATSESGLCITMDTVTINAYEITAIINNEDTIFICAPDDSVRLFAEAGPGGASFEWNPTAGLDDPTSLSPFAKPDTSTLYTFTVTSDQCVRIDSVYIHVDSIPMNIDTLIVTPVKDPYCAGEIISIFSPMYDIRDFPDIEHEWGPNDGTIQTDITDLNIGVELQDTALYFRVTTNNACRDTQSITINVIPPDVPISVTDTTLCPGEKFEVSLLDPTVEEIEWGPEELVSCTECLTTTVTVNGAPGSQIMVSVSGMKEGCPVGAGLTVTIPPLAREEFGPIPFCAGSGLDTLIDLSDRGYTNFDWRVSQGFADLSCDDCPTPLITPLSSGTGVIVVAFSAESPDMTFCGVSGVVVFTVLPDSIIANTEIDLCPGETAGLDALIGLDVSNIQWIIESGNGTIDCTDCPDPTVTGGTQQTRIRFVAKANDENLCDFEGSYILTVKAEEDFNGPSQTVCANMNTELDLTALNLTNVSVALNGPGSLTGCNDCLTPSINIGDANATELIIRGMLAGEICPVRFEIDVFSSSTIVPEIQCPSDMIRIGVQTTIGLSPEPVGATNFNWSVNGVMTNSDGPSLTFVPGSPTNMFVLTYQDAAGCDVTVTGECNATEDEPDFPNAFTPYNGDGQNDTFRPIFLGTFQIDRLRVFNRWGQLVHDGNDPNGWDGLWDGKQITADVYIYTYTLRRPDGSLKDFSGDVTLLR